MSETAPVLVDQSIVVIHVRDADFAAGDIYIGRRLPRQGFYEDSPWANPFRIGEGMTREESIAHFRWWVTTSDEPRAVYIRENLHKLLGHRCACWCKEKRRVVACHGDVLKELAEAAWVPS